LILILKKTHTASSDVHSNSTRNVSGILGAVQNITLGGIWSLRTQLPWTPIAGRDLNRDGFNTDLVPGTTRNSGGRNLNLDMVNQWRSSTGLQLINPSQIDSSRINILDIRLSKIFPVKDSIKLEVLAQSFNLFNTKNLLAQYGGGAG